MKVSLIWHLTASSKVKVGRENPHLINFSRFNNVYKWTSDSIYTEFNLDVELMVADSLVFIQAGLCVKTPLGCSLKKQYQRTAFPAKIFTFPLRCLLMVSVSSLLGRLYKYKLNSVMLIFFSCETVISFWQLVSAFICLLSKRSVSAGNRSRRKLLPATKSRQFQ